MANEITMTANLAVTKSGVTISSATSRTITMAGTEMIGNLQSIGFADAEALVVGDVSTIGYVLVKNTDETNFVQLAMDAPMAVPFAKLLPNDVALFPAASATIYAQAAVAACVVQVIALEL